MYERTTRDLPSATPPLLRGRTEHRFVASPQKWGRTFYCRDWHRQNHYRHDFSTDSPPVHRRSKHDLPCTGRHRRALLRTGSAPGRSNGAAIDRGRTRRREGRLRGEGKYQECLANIKVDQPCTASDSDNIRTIVSRMAAFEQKLEADKKEATARFALLQDTINDKILDDYVARLLRRDTNGMNALKAYEALSACLAVATDRAATCQAYIGDKGVEKPQSIKEAVAETEEYFLEQVEFMGNNIDANVAVFTGTSLRKGTDGLASAA